MRDFSFCPESLALMKASCHIIRTLKQPYGDTDVVRNKGSANSQKWILNSNRPSDDHSPRQHLVSSLMRLSWNHLEKVLLSFCVIETEVTTVCCVKPLSFGVICYAVIYSESTSKALGREGATSPKCSAWKS